MSKGLDDAINDYLTRFLLRYFRKATDVCTKRPDIDAEQDLDLLRLYWAISEPVKRLVAHLRENPHEIAAVLESHYCVDDARVRGRFDARATVIRQLVTGHSALMVSHEPLRSYNSGPNHVLIWVLEQAWQLVLRFQDKLPEEASYLEAVKACAPGLETIRRFEAIHQATKQLNLTRRPSPQAVKEGSRSRRLIYILACKAYRTLQAIEAGDDAVIIKLLKDTLLGPLDVWKRFELVIGLGMARALSIVQELPMSLGFFEGVNEPIATVGTYNVYWQSKTATWRRPVLEPSEEVVSRLLRLYGLREGADRPDLVVLDRETDEPVAVAEVKYSSNGDAKALREAANQLVRYARGYLDFEEIDGLLEHSVVALASATAGRNPEPKPDGLPLVVDFEGILEGQLEGWAWRLAKARVPAIEIQLRA